MMKTLLLSLMIFSAVFCSSQDRIPIDKTFSEFLHVGTDEKTRFYLLDSTPVNGIVYSNYKNGQLEIEYNCKDGKLLGYHQWNSHGDLAFISCISCSDTNTHFFGYSKTHKLKVEEITFNPNPSNDSLFSIRRDFFRNSRIENERIVGDKFDFWTTYFANGNKRSYWHIVKNESGTSDYGFKFWFRDGSLSSEHFYRKDLPHGTGITNYSNGQRRTEYNFENGKRIGWQRAFSKSGEIESEVELIDGNGIFVHRKGKKKIISVENYKDGFPDGVQQFWYIGNTKQLMRVQYYSNGKQNGLYQEWYENGKLKIESYYSDDLLHGIYKEWFENGKLHSEATYCNGMKDGICKEYYENGKLKISCFYKEGKLNGEKVEWNENGTLNSIGNYKDDKRDGYELSYYINGFPMYYRHFTNGIIYGKFIGWYGYAENKKDSECTYNNGKIHGLYKSWHDNGQLGYESTYVYGIQEGPCQAWHENGKPKYMGHHVQDLLILEKCWDENGVEIDCSNYDYLIR